MNITIINCYVSLQGQVGQGRLMRILYSQKKEFLNQISIASSFRIASHYGKISHLILVIDLGDCSREHNNY